MKTVQERYDESSLEKELTKQREVTLEIASAAGALERIATALEVLVRERTLPKNTKRIRVEFVRFQDGTPRMAEFLVTAATRAALGDCRAIPGQPGLWSQQDAEGRGTIFSADDETLCRKLEVPMAAVVLGGNHVNSMPESPLGTRPQFIVTVDLQPDPATWGWREWIRL